MRAKKQMRPPSFDDGLHAATLRSRQQPAAASGPRPDLALPEDAAPVLPPRQREHRAVKRDADDDVHVAIDERLEADLKAREAVLNGDVDALKQIVESNEFSPYGIVECLHLCSTQGQGTMPPSTAKLVVDMARVLLPRLTAEGLYACASKNPWFVSYNCPELLTLYAEADVPRPSVDDGDVDLAAFYVHRDAAENLRQFLTFANRDPAAPSQYEHRGGDNAYGSLLHLAARVGAAGCVAMLLRDYGMDANRDANGATPLDEVLSSRASWTPERLDIVRTLVESGADLQRRLGGKLPYQRVHGRPPQEVLETLGFTAVRG